MVSIGGDTAEVHNGASLWVAGEGGGGIEDNGEGEEAKEGPGVAIDPLEDLDPLEWLEFSSSDGGIENLYLGWR